MHSFRYNSCAVLRKHVDRQAIFFYAFPMCGQKKYTFFAIVKQNILLFFGSFKENKNFLVVKAQLSYLRNFDTNLQLHRICAAAGRFFYSQNPSTMRILVVEIKMNKTKNF